MPRLSYLNARDEESLVMIEPWAKAARVAPGGRIEITFEATAPGAGEIRVVHRSEAELEIRLDMPLISVSGDQVTELGARPNDAVP